MDFDSDLEVAQDQAQAQAQAQKWLSDQLQSSIFYVEPVTHVTVQLMRVDQLGILTRAETAVVRLTVPNIIGRLDIARIIKRSRFSADRSRLEYRLNSLFVYNAHVELCQLAAYIRNPAAFNFVTMLTSVNSFEFKPTLACFHSLNSVHVVLSAVNAPLAPLAPHTRTVRITRDAVVGRRLSRRSR